jgi:hypothetical protein
MTAPRDIDKSALLAAARREAPSIRLVSRVLDDVRALEHAAPAIDSERRPAHSPAATRWLAITGLALAAVLGVLFFIHTRFELSVRPEPSSSARVRPTRTAVTTSPLPPASDSAPTNPSAPADPCRVGVRGLVGNPLLDDFEHGDPFLPEIDGRAGYWQLVTDTDPEGIAQPLVPVHRDDGRSKFALHAKGPHLTKWGAKIDAGFATHCYDLSAFSKIEFSAKGPGHVWVTFNQVETMPVHWGGTCRGNCYDFHQTPVDLKATWARYSVPFAAMVNSSQRPVDPARVHSIDFAVLPADTPFDFWIDDVMFVP